MGRPAIPQPIDREEKMEPGIDARFLRAVKRRWNSPTSSRGRTLREALGPDGRGIGTDATLYKGPRSDALILTARRMTEDGRFVALYG